MQSRHLLNGVCGIQTGQELCKPVISVHKTSKTKHTSMMSSTNVEKSRRIVGFTRELILVNALLLCNDVALNPGHLKCNGAEFELNKTCRLCSIPQVSRQNSQDFQQEETIFIRELKNVASFRGLECHQVRNSSYFIYMAEQLCFR